MNLNPRCIPNMRKIMEEDIEQANKAKTIKKLIQRYSVEEITEGLGLQPSQIDLTYKYGRIQGDGSVLLSVPSCRYKNLSVHLSAMNPPDMTIVRQFVTPDKHIEIIDPCFIDDNVDEVLLKIIDAVSAARAAFETNDGPKIHNITEKISSLAGSLKNIATIKE